ncbi:MAG: DUF3536 domain-containing protein [Phycisphaerae bacterium]
MSERYVCIHGHFYQPPRENPWLEAIEQQDSARPFHDWNERISAECYATNAHARLLDREGRIERLVNNYARISFNFGPTLLSWMEENEPETYAAILAADAESQNRYSGHGSALAQAYNHMILPLANRRDKETQVVWGIRDFERRFRRRPEGLWLPETAVDVESLEILAAHGIRFTILSPYQAHRVRRLGGRGWHALEGGRIDPSRAYEAKLPGDKSIALFFYDGPISQGVAFERLLQDGAGFAQRLMSGFSEKRTWPQLMHIATDGESYGHHHRHGEMALAFALNHFETTGAAKLTNYGEFLERHPPTHQVEIHERTAWSCAHGVGRWERDCSCHSGAHPNWNQSWRAPLRAALDWLRDEVAPRYERAAGEVLRDPWAARDDYVDVVLDRAPERVQAFVQKHARPDTPQDRLPRLLRLMELQRHGMLMYTSCAWFFDDISGLESVQVLQYAARVMQLARELFDQDLEPAFLERLAQAPSNAPEYGDGRRVYERLVRPVAVDLMKVAAHYAISSLFEDYGEAVAIYGYALRTEAREVFENGPMRLAVGRVNVTSHITGSSNVISYAVLHQGDHNLTGGVREYQGEAAYKSLRDEAVALFRAADTPGMVRFLDQQFKAATYSLRSLFREQQRRILRRVLDSRLRQAEAAHRELYQNHAPLLRVLAGLDFPLPRAFVASVDFVLHSDLRRALEQEWPDLARVRDLLAEARTWSAVELDAEQLGHVLRGSIERLFGEVMHGVPDAAALARLTELVQFAREGPLAVDLSRAQNLYHQARGAVDEAPDEPAGDVAPSAAADGPSWRAQFAALGRALLFRVAD